jgi:hypothetical protein
MDITNIQKGINLLENGACPGVVRRTRIFEKPIGEEKSIG